MHFRCLLIFAAVAVSLASAAPPTYRVRRSALVPHPSPPAWSGQPLSKPIELRVRNSTVLVPVEPSESPGANAGLYVARHNVGGSVRARAGDNWALGVGLDVGLDEDAMQIADDSTKPPEEGATHTWRVSARYSLPLEHGWRVGFGGSAGLLSAAYHETGECIANCEGAPQYYEESGIKTVPVWSLSLLTSRRLAAATLFGGLTVENHPRNTKNGTYTVGDDDSDDELSSGPAYVLVGGGVEWQVTDDLKLLGQIYQPVSSEIARYGPVLGVSVAVDLGTP